VATAALFAFAPVAGAKTYTPTAFMDHTPDGHCNKADCTLREAVIASNAHAGADVIDLGAKHYYVDLPGPLDDDSMAGDLDVNDSLTIEGPAKKNAKLDGTLSNPVLDIAAGAGPANIKVTLDHLDVRLGLTSTNGACLRIAPAGGRDARVAIKDSAFSDCQAGTSGGGIYAGSISKLTIVKSTIIGNLASAVGGGLDLEIGLDRVLIKSSVIDHNSADDGGGLYSSDMVPTDRVKLVNSTVFGNTANSNGGGLALVGSNTMSLLNVTVASNISTPDFGGAGFYTGETNGDGKVRVENSIVAFNKDEGPTGPDDMCRGQDFAVAGKNLIQAQDGNCPLLLITHSILQSNPHLGPLTDNGGPTRTVAIGKTSKAVDRAGSGAPKRDQRGKLRDKHPDIGAFERLH
jgi:hypothetical protein